MLGWVGGGRGKNRHGPGEGGPRAPASLAAPLLLVAVTHSSLPLAPLQASCPVSRDLSKNIVERGKLSFFFLSLAVLTL